MKYEHAARAAELEAAFIAGVEANLSQARGGRLGGRRWRWNTRDQSGRVRDMLASRGEHDKNVLQLIPKNTARVLTGSVPRWLIGYKRSSVAIAATLARLEEHAADATTIRPIGLAELGSYVRELVGQTDVPHCVGVCSLSGFTDEARRSGLDLRDVTLVLIEPRADGGWRITPASPKATEADARLFDPEAHGGKVERVRAEIGRRSVDLLTGGLSAAQLAQQMGLTQPAVVAAFERVVADDSALRLGRQRDDVLLYRGAARGLEDRKMSMTDKLRQLFSREGQEARKINLLSERRALLAQRRERMYGDIAQFEAREADLLKQGKQSPSPVVKRRVATQIKQVRDDIERLTAVARVMGQQVDVVSTHIHNLTLIQQGKLAKLPNTEEITRDAVRAEEMIEQLGADVQLTQSLSVGVGANAASDEELAILAELEGSLESNTNQASADESIPSASARSRDAASGGKQSASPQREPG